jgi:hypothetical protein
MNKFRFLLTALLLLNMQVFSQVYSDKVVGDKNQAKADSIKASHWPYLLPIWGKKVTELGFKLLFMAEI